MCGRHILVTIMVSLYIIAILFGGVVYCCSLYLIAGKEVKSDLLVVKQLLKNR